VEDSRVLEQPLVSPLQYAVQPGPLTAVKAIISGTIKQGDSNSKASDLYLEGICLNSQTGLLKSSYFSHYHTGK
jgi:hypothetical protein